MSKYPHVVRAVFERPWAIRRETLAVIVDIVAHRDAGEELSDEEIRARIGAAEASRAPYQLAAAGAAERGGRVVQVLPLYGVIIPKANLFADMSGATSLQRFGSAFQQALADPDVGAILIDVDSPGGLVDGVPELAAEIRAARGTKPITAIANTDAASAAYYIAVQADELVVTPSGQVGSIGVFSAHDDISGLQEKIGVKTTLVSAGKYKTEASPYEPLSDEARAHIQETVDDYYGMFVGDVAKARGVEASAVRSGYGQGRMLTAKRALKAGMVDRIETFDAVAARLARAASSPRRARASREWGREMARQFADGIQSHTMDGPEHEPYAEHAERVVADVEALVNRSRERKESRATVGRDLSAADRGRLGALRDRMAAMLPDLDELLAGDEPTSDADALAAYAAFQEIEARLNGVAV